jgi:hypothetical protein
MLALKRSLLNRESILIKVLKALASFISMCSPVALDLTMGEHGGSVRVRAKINTPDLTEN